MDIPDFAAEAAVPAIADCYEEFVTSLPTELRTVVRHLPLRLGLTTRAGVDWTEVWDEPIELILPTLVLTQLGRPIHAELIASAQRAHLFALLGALIRERIDAGLVEPDPQLDGVLFSIDRQRHRALAELRLLGADLRSPSTLPAFCAAEREARNATAIELDVLAGEREVDTADYVAICSGKHSLALVATMAAVVAAGAELDELVNVHDLILAIMLGVGYREELLDRSKPEGSWFAALTRTRARQEVESDLRDLAVDAFERAATAAAALGARQLEGWADDQLRPIHALLGAAAKLDGQRRHAEASAA